MFKLYKECFHKTVRSYSFSTRVINDWNGLPDHVVDAGSLSSFKNLLDKHWKDCHYYYIECMYACEQDAFFLTINIIIIITLIMNMFFTCIATYVHVLSMCLLFLVSWQSSVTALQEMIMIQKAGDSY